MIRPMVEMPKENPLHDDSHCDKDEHHHHGGKRTGGIMKTYGE